MTDIVSQNFASQNDTGKLEMAKNMLTSVVGPAQRELLTWAVGRIVGLEAHCEMLKSAIGTPEVFEGVITQILEDERDTAVNRAEKAEAVLKHLATFRFHSTPMI